VDKLGKKAHLAGFCGRLHGPNPARNAPSHEGLRSAHSDKEPLGNRDDNRHRGEYTSREGNPTVVFPLPTHAPRRKRRSG
jgi:hypothetical protein